MASKRYIYCPHCGEKVENATIEGRVRQRCLRCEAVFYVNPLPVVSTLLVNAKRQVLLVLRRNEPYKGMWCLPIGFAEVDESIQDAALRELEEETGVKGRIVRLLDAQTVMDSFYGNMLMLCYEVEQVSGKIKAGDDAREARFFPIDDIPELAFKPNEMALEKYRELYGDLC